MRIAIVGAGGHAKVVHEAAISSGIFEVVCFVDEGQAGGKLLETPINAEISTVENFIVAIGDNRVRKEIYDRYVAKGLVPVTIVHPRAYIAKTAQVGDGTVILAGVNVSTCATIGDNCIINTAATVEHDCVVESHSHVSVGVQMAGNCRIEEGALVGIGSTIIPGKTVGAWSVVGGGGVVVSDVGRETTVVGVPARPLAKLKTPGGF
ncbi:MAG TPA: transferase [Candidatus Melainabacteria bacterium]|nr:transferase [Candidatus Melainabacteria bacterium]